VCEFVALVAQHAMRIALVICGITQSTVFFFPYCLIKDMILEKKFPEHKMCVLILSAALSETFLILRTNERGMIKNAYWSSCEVAYMLV